MAREPRDPRKPRRPSLPPQPPPPPSAPQPPPEPVRMSGVSMGLKMAAATALAVAIASGVLVAVASHVAGGEVDREVNGAGERLIKVLASFDLAVWKEVSERTQALKTAAAVKEIADRLLPTPPAAGAPASPSVEEAHRALAALNARIAADALPNPCERLGSPKLADAARVQVPDLLDLFVYEQGVKDPFLSLSAYAGRAPHRGDDRLVRSDEESGLEIREGNYVAAEGRILARWFKYPIRSNQGAITGWLELCLRAQQIRDMQDRLLAGLLIAAAAALVAGAGIGLVFSSTLVKPIKTLLQDIQIVAGGDLDHVTKAHSGEEIGLLARAFHAMTRNLRAAHLAELEAKAFEHELGIATEIQSNLLPKRIPRLPGWDISAFYRPSKEVGGDYYDFIPVDAEHLGIVVADVSGKGIPGSMVMTMARSLLRMEAERNLSAADTLVKTNRVLARDIRRGMFVTGLYGILNARSRTLLVASAGHNPLVVVRHASKSYELVNPNGIALGFDKGPVFERTMKEQRIAILPGDRLVAYTDGVVESMSPAHEEFGDERFYEMCVALSEKTSNEFIHAVVEALDRHQATGPQHDDITLVTARLLPG